MNNFKYIAIILVGLMMFTSCESWLEEEPKTQIATDNFYQDKDQALMALTAAYAQLKSGPGYYNQQFLSNVYASSDQGTSSWKHGDFTKGILESTNGALPITWNEIYVAIRDANNVIHKVADVDMDEVIKSRIIGEAKFLRALHYFNLVRCWGEVPLRTEPVRPGEEGGLPVSSRTDIYNVIISDLKQASENCWGRGEVRLGETNDLGRATAASAQALLARVYLHIASSVRCATEGSAGCAPYAEFGTNYKAYYDSCRVMCDSALMQPGYALASSYQEWEKIFDADKGNNPEMLFEIQGSSATGQGTSVSNLFSPRNAGLSGGGWGGTNKMIAGFVQSNVDYTDVRFDNAIIHAYEDNTFSYELLPAYNGYARYLLDTGERKGAVYNVFTSKFIDSDATTEYTSQQNWHVIRLADVYMMRAEALAEINEEPALANADVNILRSRVGMTGLDFSGLSMAEFREALLRERAAEFFMEGQRWFDLTRMGVYEEKCKIAFDPKNQGKIQGVRGPEDYTWPIPITEVSANDNIDE
ncbi:RagB/SusD family nutrient uptake outer membrane protein [Carboxylicivirga taeanensis]|uniref:RagB/SusD family nutrient uptake outer membrane protein n=1 Tax=Carboxylicivirga taeanensis TaxID=1416875 RepID=UPI003F6DE058